MQASLIFDVDSAIEATRELQSSLNLVSMMGLSGEIYEQPCDYNDQLGSFAERLHALAKGLHDYLACDFTENQKIIDEAKEVEAQHLKGEAKTATS